MMTLGPIGFAAPWVLLALAALPIIYWLLRVTPPSPRRLSFPAIRLLFGLKPGEETPARTPPWLVALRLAIAGLVIFGLAEPLIHPDRDLNAASRLVLVIDDGWAAGPHWAERTRMMDDVMTKAERAGVRVMVLPTAPRPPGEAIDPVFSSAGEARRIAQALQPRPWPTDRPGALKRLQGAAGSPGGVNVVWLSDGIDGGEARAFADGLMALGSLKVVLDGPDAGARLLLPPSLSEALPSVTVRRLGAGPAAPVALRAAGEDGRLVSRLEGRFAEGADDLKVALDLPAEIRNRIASIMIEGEASAGATVLLDDRWRRHPVGLVEGEGAERAQPLLSGLYYLDRALTPFTEVHRGTIEALLGSDIAVLVLVDVGTLSESQSTAIAAWVEKGGMLVRFAGPHLAEGNDTLLPVALRQGDRSLGGALSWEKPARLAPFPAAGPFAGLPVPEDVLVQRQVLAEPALDLGDKTWAALEDGTPLVTAARQGAGWLVLVHTTASPDWSNLPLSGLFVDMMRRLAEMSLGVSAAAPTGPMPAIATLDGFGRLGRPPVSAGALDAGRPASLVPGPTHPPGYYGVSTSRRALNLAPSIGAFTALAPPVGAITLSYLSSAEQPLKPWLLLGALLLTLADFVIALALRGLMAPLARNLGMVVLAAALAAHPSAPSARAAEAPQGTDAFAVEATKETRLAYVKTGNPQLDDVTKAGMFGLSLILNRRTAAEGISPMGVDIEEDELAFFPLIYWPIDPSQPALSDTAVRKVNAYLHNGGTILFDTRDQDPAGGGVVRLRQIAASLDIPPLVPVPADHVLTKSFYLLQDFPGRWAGGTLWVEQQDDRVNDGVSSVIIGSNDWAGAWATDETGRPLYSVVPGGERQREMAYRFGINLVMYALTGNYKADQVHVPAILERLGQ